MKDYNITIPYLDANVSFSPKLMITNDTYLDLYYTASYMNNSISLCLMKNSSVTPDLEDGNNTMYNLDLLNYRDFVVNFTYNGNYSDIID